jgi:pimeloyl-ACP methyl ester carboxylesterase
MQWRKLLMGGGAALGAAAAYNAFACKDVTALPNPLGGDDGRFDWRGYSIAYTVHGSGSPVILVHSVHASAWSYEWRMNVEALARNHTVYALDLLGFGRSSRPATRYSAHLYIALLDDFAQQVVGAPCAVVASSLSAAYAIVLGARDPSSFPALILIQPTGLGRLDQRAGGGVEVTRVALDTPVLGTAVFHGMVSHRSIRLFLEASYADNDLVTDEMVEIYYQASHQPGAKYAPVAFMGQQLNIDVRNAVRRLTQPALLVWGEQAVMTPVEEIRPFLAVKRDFDVAILDPAGDLPHDERADEFNELASAFLAHNLTSTPAATGGSA